MVIALTPSERMTVVLPADQKLEPGHPNRTEFYVRSLSAPQRTAMINAANTEPAGTVAYKTLRAALVGWANLRDGDGNEVPFETEEKEVVCFGSSVRPPTDETLNRLPTSAYFDLANAIADGQHMTRDDAKNS